LSTALLVLQILISLILIAVVMLQSGKGGGLSGAIAGGQESSFFSKSKDVDSLLGKITTVSAAVFLILALVITAVSR
jgi:preprotein translocase subunit SecG